MTPQGVVFSEDYILFLPIAVQTANSVIYMLDKNTKELIKRNCIARQESCWFSCIRFLSPEFMGMLL